MFKRTLWQGLTTLLVFLLAVFILAAILLETYRTAVDLALGTTSETLESDDTGELYSTFTPPAELLNSDGSGNSKAVIASAIDLGRRQSAEGSVLLKNVDSALPLKKDSKVTLLGVRSHSPILGAGMGVSVKGDNISLETALSGTSTQFKEINNYDFSTLNLTEYGLSDGAGAGFEVNPVMTAVYQRHLETVGSPGNSPANVLFDEGEPSLSELAAANADYASSFSDYSDAAIVVVGRPSGEGTDFIYGETAPGFGDESPLALSLNEKATIELAKNNFDKVIVLVNTNSAMEIDSLKEDPEIDAILWIGHPGNYGMLGVADILCGRVSPSGGLYDLYSADTMSAPAMMNMGDYTFSNARSLDRGNGKYIIEAEGIYVGYRYYETRYYDSVVNPGSGASSSAGVYASANNIWNYSDEVTYGFGYGLTYTDFDYSIEGMPAVHQSAHEIYIDFKVNVKNNGPYAAKSNVQVYVQAPYTNGGIEKSAVQLAGYGKTGIIAPGDDETVAVTVDVSYIASYDSTFKNADGSLGTYILDEGDYFFSVGNGAHDALNNILSVQGYSRDDGMDYAGDGALVWVWDYDYAGAGEVDGTTFGISKNNVQVHNQIDYADWNSFDGASEVTYLSRADWDGTYPVKYDSLTIPQSMMSLMNGDYYERQSGQEVTLKWDSTETQHKFYELALSDFDDSRWEELLSQMSLEEAMVLAGFGGDSLPGIASIGFEEMQACENAGNGFVYEFSTTKLSSQAPWYIGPEDENAAWSGQVFASAPVVASAFNDDLAYEEGEFVGIEALFFGVPILWGPGLNTHRHAYNGRNGEYYSEDPVLSGVTAMEFAMGARDMGLIAAPKHFAFNDQETNRSGVSPFMTEQRAREVELRAYQIAVEATKYDKERGVDTGMIGLMTSFSKIGPVECTCSRGLLTGILVEEWGFNGYAVTDLSDDTDLYYAAVYAGITGYDLRGRTNITYESLQGFAQYDGSKISYNMIRTDNDFQQALRLSNKRMVWAITQSNVMNAYNSTTHRVSHMTWWRVAYITGIAVTSVLTVAAAVMFVVSAVKYDGKEKER